MIIEANNLTQGYDWLMNYVRKRAGQKSKACFNAAATTTTTTTIITTITTITITTTVQRNELLKVD